jgi:hypothetical protein
MPPMRLVDLAIDEMRYARQQLSMRGGFLRPNPYKDRMLHDPSHEPFWTMAEKLDFFGVDRFDDRAVRHMISHTMEVMLAAMSVIWAACVSVIRGSASAFSNREAAGPFEPVEGSLSALADSQAPLCGHTVAHRANRHLEKHFPGWRGTSFARVAH